MKINKIPGEMPQVWDRSVIFFANLLSLFFGNETETEVLREEVGALESYGARLIPLINLIFSGPDNLLILEKECDPQLPAYFRKQLGLKLPKIRVIPHHLYTAIPEDEGKHNPQIKKLLAELSAHPSRWIDGYVTDRVLVRLADLIGKSTISSAKGSRSGNNKFLLYEYLLAKSLPVFDTYVARGADEAREGFRELQSAGYSLAVVKSEIGASGIGMQKINLDSRLDKVTLPDYLFFEGPCLVQGWLDSSVKGVICIGSPSVQMLLDDNTCNLHDITEQILSQDSVHEGNLSPPEYLMGNEGLKEELLRQAEIAGIWLHGQGYRGTASVDFLIVQKNKKTEVRICEINARVTGATYPSMLAHHFVPKSAWLMRNIRFSVPVAARKLLKELDKTGLLFHPAQKEGVLPFNFNPDGEGNIVKGQFLFLAKNTDDTYRLLDKMRAVETIKGIYDRD